MFSESKVDNTVETTATYCHNHPTVETSLRCNKCGQYICSRCAVRTPVGYRCKSCVNQQQNVFFTVKPLDYAITAAVGAVLGGVIGLVLGQVLLLALILGLPAGGLIAEVAFRLTGKRRGRYSAYAVGAGIVLGTIIATAIVNRGLIAALLANSANTGQFPIYVLLGPGLYVVLCAGAAATRMRYGR